MKNIILVVLFTLSICLSCKSPDARRPESVQSGTFLKESAQRNKKLNELETKKIEQIIAKSEDNYIASNHGFWYSYKTKIDKDTLMPKFGDHINFNYSVSDLSGLEIYPNRNRSYLMEKEELFTGLREGLKLMKPSESVTFIFPSQIAFGYYGDDNKIGTNVPLICNVTLNTIKPEK